MHNKQRQKSSVYVRFLQHWPIISGIDVAKASDIQRCYNQRELHKRMSFEMRQKSVDKLPSVKEARSISSKHAKPFDTSTNTKTELPIRPKHSRSVMQQQYILPPMLLPLPYQSKPFDFKKINSAKAPKPVLDPFFYTPAARHQRSRAYENQRKTNISELSSKDYSIRRNSNDLQNV
uniref:Uncharacterized LOC100186279 n=1 Tax=Ciona intestinalis TaxID=7719 RepID=H2XUI4_CIOIN|nr:uncharacterized protein LOC100186279 isoform X1 [Ciona intestinalis]|eukprot:XP_002132062.1 uncharacterized protein LOC100186279 isoform X1 [Ciona intestinalis]